MVKIKYLRIAFKKSFKNRFEKFGNFANTN